MNEKIGKASLPISVIHQLPGTIVAQRWSQSMNPMARICNAKEFIPDFFIIIIS